MMEFVTLKELLSDARSKGYAVPHFNVFNLEMLLGVLDAAQERKSPVILAYGEGFHDLLEQNEFPGLIHSVKARYNLPACIHLDHSFQFAAIESAVGAGYTSVMLDVSHLDYEENVRQSAMAVELCHPLGISVEAEVGHVGGLSEIENDAQVYTQPDVAADFVKRTGVDALAVSIGTAHGVYSKAPVLSIERLSQIREAVNTPLVLHGGSGLSDEQFISCVQNGICKVNVHTDLAMAANRSLQANCNQQGYLDVCIGARRAVCAEALKKIDLFGSANHI